MSPSPLKVTPGAARRFLRRALLIDTPAPDVATAIAHHGYIQIDPINICGRMHDLILRNRVACYREGDMMRHVHGEDGEPLPAEKRVAFEHHVPSTGVLVAFALDAWPHLLAAMRERTRRPSSWSGRLSPRERELADRIRDEIERRGPLSSDAIVDDRKARRVWGSATLVKSTMQKMFFHGRLLISGRARGRRRYDLPERVLNASVLALKEAEAGDTARWLAHLRLRQRRLVALKKSELSAVEDLVQPVIVKEGPILYCLKADAQNLSEDGSKPSVSPLLLAPLDPLIYDRRVTSHVWGFDYTWEAYTPAHKRIRGHYALPVLAGTVFVGHVEPKADRKASRLRVVSLRVQSGANLTGALRKLARFLGLQAEIRKI